VNVSESSLMLQLSMFDTAAGAAFLFRELAQMSYDGVGITRESYGSTEQAAIELVKIVARSSGLAVESDAASNFFISLPGTCGDESFVLCGSHLDSVPHGGNYDGAAGVVAGLMCLCRMRHLGIVPRRTIKLVVLRAEESAWFGKPCIGSSALMGQLKKEDFDLKHRLTGKSLSESMSAAGVQIEKLLQAHPLIDPRQIAAYLELHIEQGPVLISKDKPVGIVSGIRGNRRHRRIVCKGEAGHSGAVPQCLRHDAVLATADLLVRLERRSLEMLDLGYDLVVTSGIVNTNPDDQAITRIAGEVTFSLDIRSQSKETLDCFHSWVVEESKIVGIERGVTFEFDAPDLFEPVLLDRGLIETLRKLCERFDLEAPVMASGAGHDAAIFANSGIPSAMIFVRNENGSHNPDEAMELDDFLRATQLLYAALLEVA